MLHMQGQMLPHLKGITRLKGIFVNMSALGYSTSQKFKSQNNWRAERQHGVLLEALQAQRCRGINNQRQVQQASVPCRRVVSKCMGLLGDKSAEMLGPHGSYIIHTITMQSVKL